jgi:hypothetical protein
MRAFFTSTFFALVLLSLVAWRIQPAPPEEDYNEVWRGPIKYAEPNEWSPFVNAQAATRILDKKMDPI